ncbi:MAG TPA: F0F1 ATP synthase subunit A [Anaerolineales bacterium]|nr:F0F1 ATP synthase subunit A [Anaerolineales bacterium]
MSDHNTSSHETAPAGPKKLNPLPILFLVVTILGAIFACVLPGMGGIYGIFKPITPAVVLPAEPLLKLSADGKSGLIPFIPNSWTSMLLVDLLIIAMVVTVQRGVKRAMESNLTSKGTWYNVWEALIEYWWNTTKEAAGKHAKGVFYIVMAIFFVVWFANLTKLIPGFETVGFMETSHDAKLKSFSAIDLGFATFLDGNHPTELHAEPASEMAAEGTDMHASTDMPAAEEGGHGEEHAACSTNCLVIPFFRGLATDLNFTFALAVAVMVAVQFFGVKALGMGYFGKFVNIKALSSPGMGKIDFAVGLLEIISEFSKILSFSFRLFGNIFAGTLLLTVLGVLVPVVLPIGINFLELFVGSIQAYVFAMLALVFMSQATISHHH